MAGAAAPRGERLSDSPGAPRLRWHAGDPRLRGRIEPALGALARGESEAGDGSRIELLREKPGRRRLARIALADGEQLFVKQLRGARWKRQIGRSPAAREFKMLARLREAGVAAPEPLAYLGAPGGEQEWLATRFLAGEPLDSALARPAAERRALLEALGALVRRMHEAGCAHRDLHRENVWVTAHGPVLIDLQQGMPIAPSWLRSRDQGELDASLSVLVSLADRIRLRAAMLGVGRPFDRSARAAMRRIGRASEARVRSHAESRTRRCLLEGRRFARLSGAAGEGMRLRDAPEAEVGARLAEQPASPDPRAGWVAGHGLRARGIGAPLPIAFALTDGAGRLLLEPSVPDPAPRPEEVVALGVALRRHAVAIGPDPLIARDAEGRLGPLPLERVSFPGRLTRDQAARIDALVEAGIARADDDAEGRRRAWRGYALRLRFYDLETVTQRK